MSRPIKFRAWDGTYKKMMYSEKLSEFFHAVEQREDAKQPPPVMQFTGLLDKNVKEIYEGDVVETRYQSIGNGEVVHRNPVVWEGVGFRLDDEPSPSNPMGAIARAFQATQEVIGNIYENGDLLK